MNSWTTTNRNEEAPLPDTRLLKKVYSHLISIQTPESDILATEEIDIAN
jgi:hypothetical protein